MEEGISHEVSSLGGHQELGNLIVLYDDNYISIEDNTNIAKSEDVAARYEAYGWHVQKVDWHTADGYHEDVPALYQAFLNAQQHTEAPSFIALKTIIGWPAPNKQNTGAAHGAALGVPEVKATKKILHFDPDVDFPVEDEALNHARQVAERGKQAHAEWEKPFADWASANPERKALFDRMATRRLPDGWTEVLPTFPPDAKGIATRKASGAILDALAPVLPELWGGSADLAESNLTTMEGEPSFIPANHQTADVAGQPVRADAALRHPRARHGRDLERDRAFRRDPRLRRHVLAVQRLHAGGGAADLHDGAAGHLRVDARLHRPGRGRPDPPAGRAPVVAAQHPEPGGGPARRTPTRPRSPGGPSWSGPGPPRSA